MKQITINAAMNGFIAKVGCQTLVFQSVDLLCEELKRYLKDPNVVEKEYIDKSINTKHTMGPAVNAPAEAMIAPAATSIAAQPAVPPPRRGFSGESVAR